MSRDIGLPLATLDEVLPGEPVEVRSGREIDRRFGPAGLFRAAVTRAKELKAGALMIYAESSAAAFYNRLEAIRIGEGPFYYSPEVILPHLLYIIPRDA